MGMELLNPHVLKILISARKQDSISSISQRINLSYGWAYKWIKELIKIGIFKEKYKGVILQENNRFYKAILKFLKEQFSDSVIFYYEVLSLFGVKYCFTKTDAVYFWTRGGYNIARYREFYPVFIKIKKCDYDIFVYYCKKLNLKINAKGGVFYSPEVLKDFEYVSVDNTPTDNLNKTIEFMEKNIYNFQPALEMIKDMYGKKLKIKYKEAGFI